MIYTYKLNEMVWKFLIVGLQVTLQTWRMAWQFPFSSIIQTPQDVFEPGVVLLTPNTNAPVLQSTNSSLAPGQSLQFSFLGTKGRGKFCFVVKKEEEFALFRFFPLEF